MFRSTFYCVFITILVVISPTLYAESPCKGTSQEFWCSNNNCIVTSFVCDGDNDCGNWSDERSCEGCLRGYYSCGYGTCVEAVHVCDTICHCIGTCRDEQDCYDQPVTPPSTTRSTTTSTTTTRHTPSSGPNLAILLPSIIVSLLPIICICCCGCIRFKNRLARKPWTAPSGDNQWTAPSIDNNWTLASGNNEAPSGDGAWSPPSFNNEWTPPSVDNEAPSANNVWAPPGVNLEADSAAPDSTAWQSDLQGYQAPRYYPTYSDPSDYQPQGSNLPPNYNPAFTTNGESNYSIYTLQQHSAFDVNGQLPNDTDLPPAYESIKQTDVDIEDGERPPPPNYETIGALSAPLEKY